MAAVAHNWLLIIIIQFLKVIRPNLALEADTKDL